MQLTLLQCDNLIMTKLKDFLDETFSRYSIQKGTYDVDEDR